MNRRACIAGVLALIATPCAAEAQPTGKVYRVGYLGGFSIDEGFRQGLRSLGYVEGQNLVIEGRFHQGKIDRYPALVADLLGLPVDVIVCATTIGTAAARDGTRTIPIVMAGAVNPMSAGLIASLARPGGNVTGVILQTADVTEKRMGLLRETLPNLRRVAAFYGESEPPPWSITGFVTVRQRRGGSGFRWSPVDLGFDPGSRSSRAWLAEASVRP